MDVEGHDLAVLESLDFDRYRPQVIAVESFAKTLPDVEQTPVYRWLVARGYALVGWCGLSLLMASPEFLQARREQGWKSRPAAAPPPSGGR